MRKTILGATLATSGYGGTRHPSNAFVRGSGMKWKLPTTLPQRAAGPRFYAMTHIAMFDAISGRADFNVSGPSAFFGTAEAAAADRA
jgi:hypothetical protein